MSRVRRLRSLRVRLMLAYAGLIVVGFAGLSLLAGRQISQGAIEDHERNLETQASLVARGLSEAVDHYQEGELALSALVTAMEGYASQLDAHLTLLDANGRAWLDSDGSPPSGNLSEHPEIAAALNGRVVYDVRANERGETTVYAAAPIGDDEKIRGIIRLSTPFAAAQATVLQRWLTLGAGVALLTLAALGASLWLSASLTRPLKRVRVTALKLAGGDLSQRLPEDRVDEIGELAAAFNHMARQVEAMLEEQRAFASNASHELRTPLTTIRLRSEALREGTLDPATAEQYIAEIDDEVTRLGVLVNDLILLSRFDAGRAEPGRERVQPTRLARGLVSELEKQAAARNICLELDTPDSLPTMEASINHLRVVFRNLLDNSIKYTPDGGRVTWKLRADNGYLHAVIEDTGQGIAPEDLPHLFERFYRADKARTRTVQGVGLGLPLIQSIVHFYNGRVTITSPGLGQGCKAEVWWPLSDSQEEA